MYVYGKRPHDVEEHAVPKKMCRNPVTKLEEVTLEARFKNKISIGVARAFLRENEEMFQDRRGKMIQGKVFKKIRTH